jgi:glutamyl-tRNA reductase
MPREDAEPMYGEQVKEMPRLLETPAMTLTVFALQEHLESVRQFELERIGRRVSFRAEQQDAIEELTRGIVTRILHGLKRALEAESTDPERFALLSIMDRIFKLGEIAPESPSQNRRGR